MVTCRHQQTKMGVIHSYLKQKNSTGVYAVLWKTEYAWEPLLAAITSNKMWKRNHNLKG